MKAENLNSKETKKVLNFIRKFQSENEYNPNFLKEYNAKFNKELKHFFKVENISEETKNILTKRRNLLHRDT